MTLRHSDFHGLPRESMVPCRSRARKVTSQMTSVELARVWAEHYGYLTGPGGWIYSPTGRPLHHGYRALARQLEANRRIVVGRGINWPRS